MTTVCLRFLVRHAWSSM